MGLAAYSPGDIHIASQTTSLTPIAIDTAKSLVLPAATPVGGATLVCTISIERADSTSTGTRYRPDGGTPTTSVGQLLPGCTSTSPVTLVLRGQDIIANTKIIGVAAGNFMTYFFTAQSAQ